jgi:hypothetical protein
MAAAVVIRREMIVWRQKTHAKSEMPFLRPTSNLSLERCH